MKHWTGFASAGVTLLCLAVGAAQGQSDAGRSVSQGDASFQTLRPDTGLPDWRRAPSYSNGHPPDEGAAYVQLMPGDSRGLTAYESTGGYWVPLSKSLSSLVEASVSPATLGGGAERSVFGQLGAQLGAGWGMQVGLRRSEFETASTEGLAPRSGLGLTALPAVTTTAGQGAGLGVLTFERYWDRYRGAYTVSSSRADTGSTATSHHVEFNYFYDARSSVGIAYTAGRSFDNGFPLTTLTPVDATNLGLLGEHWFSPSWAINYNALLEDRGLQGLKPELRLGLRMRF
ncbi:MAG TPA: hypothetical protein VMH32_26460 [Burkholderiales bacterium]|nr:hypothetical protein [Burkholderiales bacterium]